MHTNRNYIFLGTSKEVITQVQDILMDIAGESSLFLHGTHTNCNESMNGAGHSRVNKRLHRSVSGKFLVLFQLTFWLLIHSEMI